MLGAVMVGHQGGGVHKLDRPHWGPPIPPHANAEGVQPIPTPNTMATTARPRRIRSPPG